MTVYLESRNQPDIGEKAVTKVILNRARKNGWPLENVVLARKQFSCWNEGVDNNPKTHIKEISTFASVAKNCVMAYIEWEAGNDLQGATHYFNPNGMVPKGRIPDWVKGMEFIVKIDDHFFYKEG